MKFKIFLLAMAFMTPLSLAKGCFANDASAEIALGGLQLRQESRVAMVKERLFLSKSLVEVNYEFLNESDKDVVTEIAFPLPEYGLRGQDFEDFKVWVDDKQISCTAEVKAYVDKRDVTKILKELNIDASSFGLWRMGERFEDNETEAQSQMLNMPKEKQDILIKEGLVEAPGKHKPDAFKFQPLWVVKKIYHWTQLFPSGQKVKIRHKYRPVLGRYPGFDFEFMANPSKEHQGFPTTQAGCPDENFIKAVELADKQSSNPVGTDTKWLTYILTTAKTWKGPIRDFELIVERESGEYVTFCWEGKVDKISPFFFRSTAKDFIPNQELTVYFVQIVK